MKYVDYRTGEAVPAAEVKPLGGKLFARVKRAMTKVSKKAANGETMLVDGEVESFVGYAVELADGETFDANKLATFVAKFQGVIR